MLKINCDLGEGLDKIDAALIPLIDQANIACGVHAGDGNSIKNCIALARQYKTQIGAHPSYPDREHFGRRSLNLPINVLEASLHEQVTCLMAYCREMGTTLSYVKPHGALYHDMSIRTDILNAILDVINVINQQSETEPLRLMLPGLTRPEKLVEQAQKKRVSLIFEGFADRAYTDSGQLVSRSKPHAVLTSIRKVETQVEQFLKKGGVYSENSQWLPMVIDSICVHGDTLGAIELVKSVRNVVLQHDR